MIPDPIEGVTTVELRDALVHGVVERCVVCPNSSAVWLDLIALGGQPVIDRHGHLTDHVALHPGCCSTLILFWANLSNHGGPGDVTLPDNGPAIQPDSAPAGAVPAAPPPATRMPRLGAYATR